MPNALQGLVVSIVAEVLHVPPESITDETRLDGDQCNTVRAIFGAMTAKPLSMNNRQVTTVGGLIWAAGRI